MLTLLLALATLFQRWTAPVPDADGDDHDLAGGDDDDGDEALGDAGRLTLRKERADRKAAEREARKERKERERLAAELEEIKQAQQSDDEKRLEAVRKEAREEAEREVRQRYLKRAVSAEVRALAATKGFINADEAELLADLDDDLDPDSEEFRGTIAAALDALAEERPHLLGSEPKTTVSGGGDGGAKRTTTTAGENISPTERLRRAYAKK